MLCCAVRLNLSSIAPPPVPVHASKPDLLYQTVVHIWAGAGALGPACMQRRPAGTSSLDRPPTAASSHAPNAPSLPAFLPRAPLAPPADLNRSRTGDWPESGITQLEQWVVLDSLFNTSVTWEPEKQDEINEGIYNLKVGKGGIGEQKREEMGAWRTSGKVGSRKLSGQGRRRRAARLGKQGPHKPRSQPTACPAAWHALQVELGLVTDLPTLMAPGLAGVDKYTERTAPEAILDKPKYLG